MVGLVAEGFGQPLGLRLEGLLHRHELPWNVLQLLHRSLVVRELATMRHDGECNEQRLQIEGFAGRIVFDEIHEGMISLLAQRCILVADECDHGRALRLAEVQRRNRLPCCAGDGGNDDDRARTQRMVATRNELRGDFHIGRKAGAPLHQLCRRLHEDRSAARAEEEDVAGTLRKVIADHRMDRWRQCDGTGLDAQVSVDVEVQHQVMTG